VGGLPRLRRPELIEDAVLMALGERIVEALAQPAGMGVEIVSAHLQVLACWSPPDWRVSHEDSGDLQ
jgi:hypothetical protein